MSTQYSEIFERFLSKIADYDLAALTDEQLKKSLLRLLNSSVANFLYCTKNLKDRDDSTMAFNVVLDDKEQEILSKLMLIEWINPYILNQDNISNILGSKDYKTYSPANLLDKLLSVKKSLQQEIQGDLTFYYYAT